MNTPRFLDVDGLDGVLIQPAKKSKFIFLALLILCLVIALLCGFLYVKTDVIQTFFLKSVNEKLNTVREPVLEVKIESVDTTSEQSVIFELPEEATASGGYQQLDKYSAAIQSDRLSSKADVETVLNDGRFVSVPSVEIKATAPTEKNISEVKKLISHNLKYKFSFKFSSTSVELVSATEVKALTYFIEQCDNTVSVIGHTCNLGSVKYNYQLGLNRAKAMYKYLVKKGIKPNALNVISKGMTEPIADNKARSGRKLNRRVELLCLQ